MNSRPLDRSNAFLVLPNPRTTELPLSRTPHSAIMILGALSYQGVNPILEAVGPLENGTAELPNEICRGRLRSASCLLPAAGWLLSP